MIDTNALSINEKIAVSSVVRAIGLDEKYVNLSDIVLTFLSENTDFNNGKEVVLKIDIRKTPYYGIVNFHDDNMTVSINTTTNEQESKRMTSYEFEKVAKNAVIETLKDYDITDVSINDLDFVWFAHELGYKKCTIYGKCMGSLYAEVTYNRDTNEMYVDLYKKVLNKVIKSKDFNYNAE